jgi:PAS domain S-box-containing protein
VLPAGPSAIRATGIGSIRVRRPGALAVGALAVSAVTSLLAPDFAAAQVLNLRHYGSAEGLPQAQILAIAQDAQGFLWLGNYAGLTRFDGREFVTLSTRDGLVANTVRDIDEVRPGRLVVGTLGGVCFFEAGAFECVGEEDGLVSNTVQDVLPVTGGVWVATEGGVSFIAEGSSIRNYTTADGLPSNNTLRPVRDSEGRIWVATDRGLARLEGDRFVPDTETLIGDVPVGALLATPTGLAVGTTKGLYVTGPDGAQGLPIPDLVDGTVMTDAALDGSGTLWITTREGVIRQEGGVFERFTTRNGLVTDQVNRVMVDRERNVWFATDFGLDLLVPSPFRQFAAADGLPNPFVRALALDASGRLWVGTRDGVAYLDGGVFRRVDLRGMVADPRVYALTPAPVEGMLIGTRSGLVLYHPDSGEATTFTTANGLPDIFVLSLESDGRGGTWIGTSSGLARLEEGRITRPDLPGLPAGYIMTMLRDSRDRLWLGLRTGGALVWDGETVTSLSAANGLTDETIWSMDMDGDGAIWLGTNGNGVFRVAGDEIRRMDTRDGLADNAIWQVLSDSQGAVWLFSSRGLDRVQGGNIVHYGPAEGLTDTEGAATAAVEDDEGQLWFGTGSGVYRYSPDREVPNTALPPIYVEAFVAGGQALPLQGARVPPGSRAVAFHFTAPSFRDPAAMRFRHRLEGADPAWSPPTSEHVVTYASVSPGSYRFEVEAINGVGLRSAAPAVVAFSVLPAFWQTWWFRLMGLLALSTAIATVPVIRARRLDVERRRLEAVVGERTTELQEKNLHLHQEMAEREAAEATLRIAEEREREILEKSTNLFYARGPDHVVTYVSPQVRRFLDCDPEDALVPWTRYLSDHPDNAAGLEAAKRAVETGERQPPYEVELQGCGGRRIWVLVNEAPVVEDGATTSVVGSLTDMTQAREAEEQRLYLEEQLREAHKMEAVGRLAGGVAHDFNNLLTSVLCYSEFVAEDLPEDHPGRADIAEVQRAARRGGELVGQLMAFSRRQVVRRRVIDLNLLVQDTGRMLKRVIGEDIELVVETYAEPALVDGDTAQMEQVLMNLSVNARDAMPTGGRLVISVGCVVLDEALRVPGVADVPPGSYRVLTVTDTGVGMDGETIKRAFEPFFTTKGVGDGSGLGLSMVYGVVKQNDGHITVESTPGLGTTFRIYLPPTKQEAQVPETGSDKTGATGGVVLLVEDEDPVRRALKRAIERHGYSVIEAQDGPTAIEVSDAFEGTIDLLVSDVIMPGMTGVEVAERITQSRPGLPVLFISGYAEDVLASKGAIGEGVELVQKPFTLDELVERIDRMVGRG